MLCKLRACRKCSGDLVLDNDEWRCWQCGKYYYPRPASTEAPPSPVASNHIAALVGSAIAPLQRRGRRAPRDINTVITAKDRSENRWWDRNEDVIRHLDEGRTVREISMLIGRGQRQIRVIRERLNDIRSNALELAISA